MTKSSFCSYINLYEIVIFRAYMPMYQVVIRSIGVKCIIFVNAFYRVESVSSCS